MEESKIKKTDNRKVSSQKLQQIKTEKELEIKLKDSNSREQLYSIALFDILGFSNFVQENGNEVILNLYNKLLDLINKQKSTFQKSGVAGSVVPVPVSEDCRESVYIADANGYINVCHFSDTFIIYVNYLVAKQPFWLADRKHEEHPLLLGEVGTIQYPIFYKEHRIYLSFLQTCMDFFCQAIIEGIPLRGCISTGLAVMDNNKSIFFGNPLVEAARGETVRNSIGICFGKSFNNHHPIYNDYFIPYLNYIKEKNSEHISPMMLDWARYWRNTPNYNKYDFYRCVNKMNKNSNFSYYYDNAIKFFDFSKKHQQWFNEINRENMKDIIDYYERVKNWFNNLNDKDK